MQMAYFEPVTDSEAYIALQYTVHDLVLFHFEANPALCPLFYKALVMVDP